MYAPNKTPDQCSFYDKLNNYIEEYVANTERRLIVGGDFNVPLNPDFDCSGGNSSRKDSVRNIQDLCLDFDLVDIWRVRNPQTKRFTCRQKSPFIQRRLHDWLTSDCCQEDIEPSQQLWVWLDNPLIDLYTYAPGFTCLTIIAKQYMRVGEIPLGALVLNLLIVTIKRSPEQERGSVNQNPSGTAQGQIQYAIRVTWFCFSLHMFDVFHLQANGQQRVYQHILVRT